MALIQTQMIQNALANDLYQKNLVMIAQQGMLGSIQIDEQKSESRSSTPLSVVSHSQEQNAKSFDILNILKK